MGLTIAIDGPVGAGKSTIARGVADALSILHLDTGAMYRALAIGTTRAAVDPLDREAVEALCARLSVRVSQEKGGQRTFLGEEDVTDIIRTPEISSAASAISTHPGVRARMVALQRQYADRADMVLDGRDIGTRVLPDATFKFYLDAPPEVRASRRFMELREKGDSTSPEKVLEDIKARDAQDMGRAADPLRKAEDAIVVDTGGLTAAEVVSLLVKRIREDMR